MGLVSSHDFTQVLQAFRHRGKRDTPPILTGKLWTYHAVLSEQTGEQLAFILKQMKAAEGATGELKARKLKAGKLKARNQLERVGRMKKFPPVRLDVHSSIQPTPAFAKLALARSCVCIRSRVLLIWKWIATAQVEKIFKRAEEIIKSEMISLQKCDRIILDNKIDIFKDNDARRYSDDRAE